ncbi:MAG TPA: DUF2330 domain-containing protein, partial [Nannocystaceae bacterium]|nr:DUF2330 domain-containing protein [Nannocystaceae bacterium]
MNRRLHFVPVSAGFAAVAGLVAALHSAPASACGGTFCDAGPQGMPVDQTGENIIFAFNGTTVEVHIQIAYDPNTDASKFSWIVPVQALPKFYVGSQLLFDNVLNGTVPFYGLTTTNEFCGDGGSTGGSGTSGASSGSASDGETGGGGGGPDVVFSDQVGAFEVVVLKGGTAQEVLDWLAANGYQQPPETGPIIQEYLDEGSLFAAFKLLPGAEPVVHPVIFEYEGAEPCVPIRLTRVAAKEDMDIRVFFLGDHRAVPTNYRHVLVNPLKIDWPAFGANYKEVITAAVDAFKAEGNAFVTEYAGPSGVISQNGLWSVSWSAADFMGLPVIEVANTLMAQGLLFCDEYELQCYFNHPLLGGLVDAYVPTPDGIAPYDFLTCMSCYEGMIDAGLWGDGSAFAADFSERIVVPGQRAWNLLQTKPYVTRMYTTISPQEMMADPVFAENPDLPAIPSQRFAQRYVRCDGHAEYTLPDGRVVFVPNNGPWPDFQAEMPWEEETSQMAMAGAPQVLQSNTALIDDLLAQWNQQNTPAGTTGGTEGTGGSSGSSGSGSGGADTETGGCGCRAEGGEGSLAALGLLG